MNIQEYISSGAIESYVLGLASAEERAEFERYCELYPEIKAAREAFELVLEKRVMENAVEPPASLKQKIEDAITGKGKVIPITPNIEQTGKFNWLRIAAAACVVLLLGSIIWNINLNKENRSLKNELTSMSDQQKQMDSLMASTKSIIDNPNIKAVNLMGTDVSPASFARVYWDTTAHDVYLVVNNLPAPATDKQYQLWAILNGKPIDMGMLEISEKPLQVYRMKNASSAQAFAITLEKKGGTSAPEGKMYVMGNL